VKRSFIIVCVIALFITLAASVVSCAPEKKADLNIVTSTSIIANIVENIGGDHVSVVNIIPPAQCPGHFDIKPGDIKKLANASIFFFHGWQGEKFSDDIIKSANNPNLIVEKLDIDGNWMVPSVQVTAAEKIGGIMGDVDTVNKATYDQNIAAYQNYVENKETELKGKLSKLDVSNINVLCADQQEGFINWMGLNVVSIFGRPETLTPQIIQELVDKGKDSNVVLVIDNLQSGPDAGKAIAQELGCARVILSNFPGGFEGINTWDGTIDKNIELILTALGK
jgi:zinc transport system substrate-binding protein